jgi:uncharacterized damage-inducible protein DinB
MNRDAYLHYLRDRRARFHAVLGELGLSLDSDDDLRRQVGGGWTLGEHLVHIAAWERRYARVASRAPRLPYPSNWQKFNDAVYAEWRDVTPEAARVEYEDAHREMVAAIDAFPPEGDPERPGLLDGWDMSNTASHYREHATILLEAAGRPKPPAWRGRIVE